MKPECLGLVATVSILSACTSVVPGSFRLTQLQETFSNSQAVNTKLDILFVVDNSASMDPSQKSLRNGFTNFANKYMKPSWDIQVGVITTDTYLANARFANYRSSFVAGRPNWNSDWAKLLNGNHDGPMAASCTSSEPYFYSGYGKCSVREAQTGAGITGVNECVNPSAGQDSSQLCLNTLTHDTVHSGTPVVKTLLPAGQDPAAWTTKLVRDFMTNVSTGATGSGVEQGLGSILQFLVDNENGSAPNPLFRKGSLRVIVIVSDEDDQTIYLGGASTQLNPASGYSYDVSDIGDGGTGHCRKRTVPCAAGACPQVPSPTNANNFVANPDTSNSSYTYTISWCTPQSSGPNYGDTGLMSVNSVKSTVDKFFTDLDGTTGVAGAAPNYFVTSVIPLTGEALYALHQNRGDEDVAVLGSGHRRVSSDYGQRYVDFDAAVGNGSFEMNLIDPAHPDTTDFTPILDKIGQVILSKKSVFILSRAPSASEDMLVSIVHAGGTSTSLTASQFSVSGTTLTITDQNVILSFASTDQVSVTYQPKTVY